jgi:EAL domain-containing protein (putative c-di-GMP-specific phosphodiesterase class I)
MELETVAEYVESDKAKALITKLGVDFGQGHTFGRPVPLLEVLDDLGEVSRKSTA